MAVARLKFLDKREEEFVHAQSIKSLKELGVLVRSHKVLKTLESAGASVDYKTGIAKIPERVVNEAVKKAPPQYWAADGVHPTMAGAYLMAQAWLKAVLGKA